MCVLYKSLYLVAFYYFKRPNQSVIYIPLKILVMNTINYLTQRTASPDAK